MDYLGTLAYAQECSRIAPYLTYVYSKGDQIKTWHGCGVKTIDYMSPSMPYTGTVEYSLLNTTHAAAQAKDCSGNTITTYSGKALLMDPHTSDAAPYYQAVIDAHLSQDSQWNGGQQPDLMFSDNSDDGFAASATPCGYAGWADWSNATASVLAQMKAPPIILNALALPTAFSRPPTDDTNANILLALKAPSVAGAMLEGFVWNNKNAGGYYDNLGRPASAWVSQEDMQIATLAAGKLFNVEVNGPFTTFESDPTTAAAISARMYVYTSFLLTYDPTGADIGSGIMPHVLWGIEIGHSSTGINETPEEQFVALYPVQTAKQTVNELQIGTSGLYEREFLGCYYAGTLVGKCAVVVNPSNTASVPVSLPQYTHSVVVSGSDILDGGAASMVGPQVTSLAPNTGAILLP